MCWITYGIPSVLIAETDIPILKVGVEDGNIMISPYTKFSYELGKTYKMPKINPICVEGRCYIHEGFHSYDPRELQLYHEFWCIIVAKGGLRQELYPVWMDIFEGFIPKGSHYYLNMRGELVSDGICITNKKI
jgi:hypothetical protein